MTGKEMEDRSGVARANIRYYEAEGLLNPARSRNGYRNYSEEDLALLEKIKLLRRLGVSVQEVRELIQGSAELSAVLDRRLEELEAERAALEQVRRVCSGLREESPSFADLDAARYLSALDAPEEGAACPPLPETDALPACTSAARRFFARAVDWWLTECVLVAALSAGESLSRASAGAIAIAAEVAVMVVEPVLLWAFGTTPGKALLGLRLSRPDGERGSVEDWYARHMRMLWHGLGAWLPIWSLYQGWRSWKRCKHGEPQPWDSGFAYRAKPYRRRMAAAAALAVVLATVTMEAVNSASQLPPNRGAVTVAEFAENYNRQTRYYGWDDGTCLDETGVRKEAPWEPGQNYSVVIDVGGKWQGGEQFDYTVQDGVLTAVSMTWTARNAEHMLAFPLEEAMRMVASFAWTSKETPFWSFGRKGDLGTLAEADWSGGFSAELSGSVVTVEVRQEGFRMLDAFAVPEEGVAENAITYKVTVAV